ncbi:MAG: ribulose-phosphate 3-epimerase [Candidatus Sericytochromatia bacterium]|nr:ribulose-phosphate 3-epimerase [Candidatus Sericytochromatia bacterium]
MTLIAPSLLSADFAHLAAELKSIERAGADWIHLDVMDGRFVPNLTFGPPLVAALRPHTGLPIDVHLMIEEPERSLEAYVEAGADRITVHAEATVHLQRTLASIRRLGVAVGVSLCPATPLAWLEDVLDAVDQVLMMSVNPGFGGQSFLPSTWSRLERLRRLKGDRKILTVVDGGVGPANAQRLVQAGVEVLVAGSAVFGQADREAAIRALRIQDS